MTRARTSRPGRTRALAGAVPSACHTGTGHGRSEPHSARVAPRVTCETGFGHSRLDPCEVFMIRASGSVNDLCASPGTTDAAAACSPAAACTGPSAPRLAVAQPRPARVAKRQATRRLPRLSNRVDGRPSSVRQLVRTARGGRRSHDREHDASAGFLVRHREARIVASPAVKSVLAPTDVTVCGWCRRRARLAGFVTRPLPTADERYTPKARFRYWATAGVRQRRMHRRSAAVRRLRHRPDPAGYAHIGYSHDAPALVGSGTYTGDAVQTGGATIGAPN